MFSICNYCWVKSNVTRPFFSHKGSGPRDYGRLAGHNPDTILYSCYGMSVLQLPAQIILLSFTLKCLRNMKKGKVRKPSLSRTWICLTWSSKHLSMRKVKLNLCVVWFVLKQVIVMTRWLVCTIILIAQSCELQEFFDSTKGKSVKSDSKGNALSLIHNYDLVNTI